MKKLLFAFAIWLLAIPLLSSALTFNRPLAYGSSGTDVSALQQYLKDQGYFHYPDITGYFGSYTWRAVAAFQWDNNLEPVGYLGPKSKLALNQLLDQSLASLATSTPATQAIPTATSTISLVPTPPTPPIYTTPPPTPAMGQPWQAVSGGGGGGPPAATPAPTPSPAPYVAKAVHFDGSSWLRNGSLVATDGNVFSLSVWIKTTQTSYATYFVVDPENTYTHQMSFDGDHVNISVFHQSVDTTTTDDDGAWHHVLFSIDASDLGNIVQKVFVDDVDATGAFLGGPPEHPTLFNGLPFWFGSDSFGSTIIADIADVWIAPNVSLLSGGTIPETTRRKFVDANGKPVDLGTDCSAPTGTAPAVCLSGDSSSFVTNKGTGGFFTTTGTLTDAASSPSN